MAVKSEYLVYRICFSAWADDDSTFQFERNECKFVILYNLQLQDTITSKIHRIVALTSSMIAYAFPHLFLRILFAPISDSCVRYFLEFFSNTMNNLIDGFYS